MRSYLSEMLCGSAWGTYGPAEEEKSVAVLRLGESDGGDGALWLRLDVWREPDARGLRRYGWRVMLWAGGGAKVAANVNKGVGASMVLGSSEDAARVAGWQEGLTLAEAAKKGEYDTTEIWPDTAMGAREFAYDCVYRVLTAWIAPASAKEVAPKPPESWPLRGAWARLYVEQMLSRSIMERDRRAARARARVAEGMWTEDTSPYEEHVVLWRESVYGEWGLPRVSAGSPSGYVYDPLCVGVAFFMEIARLAAGACAEWVSVDLVVTRWLPADTGGAALARTDANMTHKLSLRIDLTKLPEMSWLSKRLGAFEDPGPVAVYPPTAAR